MASNLLTNDPYLSPGDRRPRAAARETKRWQSVLRPLASLKLTVTLFALGIFLVFAGTVAQVDQENLVVVGRYFHSFIAWIEVRAFFPRTWGSASEFPYNLSFPFPGGWTIGGLLLLNLFAAHGLRFKLQAHGKRLAAGLAVIAAGVAVTWCIIRGLDTVDAKMIWNGMKLALAALLGLSIFALATISWKRLLEVGFLGVAIVAEAVGLGLLLYHSEMVPDASSMRILWELIQGSIAGLVLLAGCILAFKKRGAIVLIHAGIALMMVNDIYVSMTAIEAQMSLHEHQVQNYVENIQTCELAVVDRSGKVKDDVTVVSKDMLQSNAVVRNAELPFDFKVEKFLQNSKVVETIPKNEHNLATAGLGLKKFAAWKRPGTGTDTDANVDISAAYVTLYKKGTDQSLGTYLVSVEEGPQPIKIDGTEYDIALRPERTYKPYVVELLSTNSVNYPGTDTPQSYESYIHLIDTSNGTNRDNIHIWMNNPLRYNGQTFYQTNYAVDKETGEKISTLAVVSNRGWMIPYVGCMIVAVGLLAHFFGVLMRFLRRRASGEMEAGQREVPMAELAPSLANRRTWRTTVGDFFPWISVAILIGWACSHAVVPATKPKTMDLYQFGQLPVMYEGRVKPYDTLARNSLKALSDYQTWVDDEGHEHSAVEWLLDVVSNSPALDDEPVFKIDDKELRDMLGITAREEKTTREAKLQYEKTGKIPPEKKRRSYEYSIAEFRDGLKKFIDQRKSAADIEESGRSAFQRQILEFGERLDMFAMLNEAFTPRDPNLPTEEQIAKDPRSLMAAAEAIRDFNKELLGRKEPLSVPPPAENGDWQPYSSAVDFALLSRSVGMEMNPHTVSLTKIFEYYKSGDVDGFNTAVTDYSNALSKKPLPNFTSSSAYKLAFESFFNHFDPFFYGWILYLLAFIMACLGLLGWSKPLNRAAFWLVAATLVIHTAALIARIYISGRPPVTTLYSAAVFIGWAGVLLGLGLELMYRLGIGTLTAALAGFLTLLVAQFLASSGDTFTVMRAVLDTQFWLATHVVCITLGYATTFIAGLLGVVYVVLGLFTPKLSQGVALRRSTVGATLARMIYGVICFAIFFSFVGTVLGGLWADNSWGRFWGWDPKENGALIIVVWNALVLHARWDGMVKDRGLAVLAIGGNIAVAWSGFGVNELGAGLHAYAGNHSEALWLFIFAASQLALIILGCLPKRLWSSFRTLEAPPAA